MSVLCTPHDRAAFVGGATQLVVPGELTAGIIPPKCKGSGAIASYEGDALDCPDCIDGRKRVALAVTCPNRHAFRGGWADCVRCDEHGQVVFAHATVEVLPVYERNDWDYRWPCVTWNNVTGVTRLWNGAIGQFVDLTLDPLPVPGRDFVVLLDNVELAK